MLIRSRLLLVLLTICGCSVNAPAIVLPTTPFTDEQKIAIEREDAEACNCGCDTDLASTAGHHLNP